VVPSEYNAVPDWYRERSPHTKVIGATSGVLLGGGTTDSVAGTAVADELDGVVDGKSVPGPPQAERPNDESNAPTARISALFMSVSCVFPHAVVSNEQFRRSSP
jgi:hypothetical protein